MSASGAGLAGRYAGELAQAYRSPELLALLADLPALLAAPAARLIATGRNRNIRIELPAGGRRVPVMVKAFGTQSLLRDLRDRRRGSKAQRTWQAAAHLAAHGAGTPRPIGYLERWEGGRLRESYYLAEYQDGAATLREALLELFDARPPLAARFVQLLECVAAGVRRMHDAGFVHNDLGNQNVLLHSAGPAAWRDFMVVDLNRGRLRRSLGLRQRGRDLSRLELPSDLQQMLVEMYWRGVPPRALLRSARLYRRLYGLQVLKRRLLQALRGGVRDASERDYPAPRELWIWDEPTAQPISALLRRDRARLFPLSRYRRVLVDGLRAAPGVWREYRALRRETYAHPVQFAGRVGLALEPTPATRGQELALLAGLGPVPALVRFYHHDGEAARAYRADLVHDLHRAGHAVSVALVQDRRALREPASWRAFAREVLERIAPVVQEVEVGHAINRVKWGVWRFEELRALYAPLPDLQSRFPALRFTGPAAIDFEYPAVFPALREWPRAVPLAALSHHLYVDRRGAPENPQDGFGAPEKFALGRAVARAAPGCADRCAARARTRRSTHPTFRRGARRATRGSARSSTATTCCDTCASRSAPAWWSACSGGAWRRAATASRTTRRPRRCGRGPPTACCRRSCGCWATPPSSPPGCRRLRASGTGATASPSAGPTASSSP
jgi:lipopolysaccharide kinase (Kdo/WaaP) family protein